MDHSIEFYQCVVEVIESLAPDKTFMSRKDGESISGNYWPAVISLFQKEGACTVSNNGDIYITQPQKLNPIYEDCLNHIERLKRAEADRKLDNATKRWSIFGVIISLVSLALSVIALIFSLKN